MNPKALANIDFICYLTYDLIGFDTKNVLKHVQMKGWNPFQRVFDIKRRIHTIFLLICEEIHQVASPEG